MSSEFDPQGLLNNWFKDTREEPDQIPARMDWWFGHDNARDRWLADSYGADCNAAVKGDLCDLETNPDTRLALILLLDQMPRNLYRGSAQAFASDDAALHLCVEGHKAGMDNHLLPIEKVFFWMPLQHVEDLSLQELGVSLYESLAHADPYRSQLWKGIASYARLHHDLIARFGRFPHRNAVLGREPVAEETEYLAGGGQSFGQ